jgi:hypothetical protein
MIQRRKNARFPPETGQTLRIRGECRRQDLNRDIPIELEVARAINRAHAAGAKSTQNPIVLEQRSGGYGLWRVG